MAVPEETTRNAFDTGELTEGSIRFVCGHMTKLVTSRWNRLL